MKKLFSFILITLIATFGIANANAQGNYYLSFDGVDDYVDFGDNSDFDFGTNTFEIEIDFEINEQKNQRLVSKRVEGSETGFPQYYLTLNDNGSITFVTYSDLSSSTISSADNIVNTNTRYNLIAKRLSNGYMELILDDNVVASDTLPIRNVSNNGRLWFGADNRDNIEFLNGNIYNVKFYENNTLISEYLFTEGTGNTLTDSVGNNDGTIYGATWVPEGQYNLGTIVSGNVGLTDGDLDSPRVDQYRTDKIAIINDTIILNNHDLVTAIFFYDSNDNYLGFITNSQTTRSSWVGSVSYLYQFNDDNIVLPNNSAYFVLYSQELGLTDLQPENDLSNVIAYYESPVDYPLSVNVDSNYGDYLDVDLTYVDNNENITDYFINATIDSSSDAYSLSAPSTIQDFTFLHWFNLDTNTIHSTNNPTISGNVSEDINFRAIYTGVPTYNLNLNIESGIAGSLVYSADSVNGRTITRVDQTITEEIPEGTSFTVTAPQPPSGFQFDGWFNPNTNNLFTTNFTWSTPSASLDYVFEARYSPIPYFDVYLDKNYSTAPDLRITYDDDGDNVFTTVETNSLFNPDNFIDLNLIQGTEYFLDAVFPNDADTGLFTFEHWYDVTNDTIVSEDIRFGFPTFNILTNDIHYRAVWSLPPEYEINLTLTSQIGDIRFQVDNDPAIFAPSISETIFEGSEFEAEAPTDSDYRFNHWYDLDNDVIFNPNLIINASNVGRDYTLEARYSEAFDVSFDTSGGTTMASIIVYDGDSMTIPSLPTREGFYLQGWNDLSTQFELIQFPYVITQDTTLKAQWQPMYTIDFNSNGGTIVESIYVSASAIATQQNDPSRFGYIFQGWFTDNQTFQNEYTFTQPVNSDIVLHAKWIIGSDSDISETLNNWVANSGISSLFIVLVILIAISVSLGIIGSNMFVIIISNLSIIFVFTALGFIPLWIVLVAGLGVIGFIIMNVFGGRNG